MCLQSQQNFYCELFVLRLGGRSEMVIVGAIGLCDPGSNTDENACIPYSAKTLK